MDLSFRLENFEGPLDLLIYLIQKQELEICDILLKKITEQFLTHLPEENIDQSSEFLGLTSSLLLMKSRKLLPTPLNAFEIEEDEIPKWELFQQLYEYCQFKLLAEKLSLREESQSPFFSRGLVETAPQKNSGLNSIELSDLSLILKEILSKKPEKIEKIQEEQWSVADKISEIESSVNLKHEICLFELLDMNKSRQELIVIFLAILELMKDQKISLVNINSQPFIIQSNHHASGT